MIYKSCRMLEHGIYIYLEPYFENLVIGHCCNTDHLKFSDRLYIYDDIVNKKLSWDYIFSVKRKLRENAKRGIIPVQCEGCFELKENNWDNDDYINQITIGHITKCNSRCRYCSIGLNPELHNKEQIINVMPYIKELVEKKLLRYNGSLRFVGGEPTLMKEFDYLVDLFSKNNVTEIFVPTSGIRLSKSLCKALERVDWASIVVSVDSGTEETFKKVKGTNFFKLVHKNLKTYLSHAKKKNFVISKFILYTNYNDTSNEIEMWLKNCKRIGITDVQFDSEHRVSSSENCEDKKYINRTLKMLDFAEREAKKYGLNVTSFLAFMNRTKHLFDIQLGYYNNNMNKFIDLNLSTCNIDSSSLYKDLYLDLDCLVFSTIKEKVDKLVKEDKFSPLRKVYIHSTKEITKTEDFDIIVMTLLRLGFDLVFQTSETRYKKIIDEILKTSNSEITFKLNSKIPFLNKLRKYNINNIYRNRWGNISFT